MRRGWNSVWGWIALGVWLGSSGCASRAAGVPTQRDLTGGRGGDSDAAALYSASPDRAKIIFVRHESGRATDVFHLVDEARRPIATLRGDMHVVLEVEPGDRTFYLLAERNAEVLRATLEAGKTYAVETHPHGAYARGAVAVQVVPIARLAEVRGWVLTTPAREVRTGSLTALEPVRAREVEAQVERAEQDWSRHDFFWQERHTLTPRHGVQPEFLHF